MPVPSSSVPIGHPKSVPEIMRCVLLALLPAAILHVFFYGCGIVIQFIFAALVGAAIEAVILRLRGMPWRGAVGDLSVFVLAAMFVIALPPYTPYWFTLGGVAFAVIVGKHLYGGLGGNLFNPAMAGYAFILVSYPALATQWPLIVENQAFVGPMRAFGYIFMPSVVGDIVSGATALSHDRTPATVVHAATFGIIGSRSWEWINLGFFLGGVWLVFRQVISWRIPTGVLCGIAVPAAIYAGLEPESGLGAPFHVLAGAAVPAAFFIATDPVTSPATPRAMLVFGFGVGLLTFWIRKWGAYPDGIAFSILIMNALVPSLDSLFRSAPYGRRPRS